MEEAPRITSIVPYEMTSNTETHKKLIPHRLTVSTHAMEPAFQLLVNPTGLRRNREWPSIRASDLYRIHKNMIVSMIATASVDYGSPPL